MKAAIQYYTTINAPHYISHKGIFTKKLKINETHYRKFYK
jgi:hypothetical protein